MYAAAATARSLGDADRLAQAVLVNAQNLNSAVDEDFVALIEEVLAAVGTVPTPQRARLLIGLAVQLSWDPDLQRRNAVAREALALARETRDPEALALVLTRGWTLIDGSVPFLDDLKALNDEAESVARDAGDPVALADALHMNAFNAACRGDRATFEARIDESARIYTSLRRPLFDWTVHSDATARAEHHGELALAEALAEGSAEIGRRADVTPSSLMNVVGGQLYQIRRAQGRLDEMLDLLAGLVQGTPTLPLLRLVLLGAYVETDRIEEARPHYLWLADNECANVPPDLEYPVTLCGLGRMAFDIRPPDPLVEYMYERLTPFAGTFNWSGQLITDPNDLGLAVMDAVLGRGDEADRHFAAAIALCARAGARANLARSEFAWARILADRGDPAAAREHAEIAVALGEELGMDGPFGIVPRGRALLDLL
jgi:hypothetical protein